jgi:hypothetical protein
MGALAGHAPPPVPPEGNTAMRKILAALSVTAAFALAVLVVIPNMFHG